MRILGPNQAKTSIPGVYAFTQPPENFDPVQATNEELMEHGYPVRPGNDRTSMLYEHWAKHVTRKTKWLVPDLVELPNRRGIAQRISQAQQSATKYTANSLNWSGSVVVDLTNPWSSESASIEGEWIVPGLDCYGVGIGPFYCCQWVGIDGWEPNAPFLFQCGTETDIGCGVDGGLEPRYFWYEWLPGNQVKLNNLGVHSGDHVMVVATINPGPKYLFMFLNVTTMQSVQMEIQPTGGQHIVGNSVEWIVERTEIDGAYSNLANFGKAQLGGIASFNNTPGLAGAPVAAFAATPNPTGILYEVSMIQGGSVVSSPALVGEGANYSQVLCTCAFPQRPR
jgi:Peptidase A4 family